MNASIDSSLLAKIKKLLNLANNNANVHEAASAMARAQDCIVLAP